jgi:hypothetical protein
MRQSYDEKVRNGVIRHVAGHAIEKNVPIPPRATRQETMRDVIEAMEPGESAVFPNRRKKNLASLIATHQGAVC